MNLKSKEARQSFELFKPIPVSSPNSNELLFFLRCLVDLQLKTIAAFLRPELKKVSNNVIDIGAGNSPWKCFLPEGAKYYGLDIESAADFTMRKNDEITYRPFRISHKCYFSERNTSLIVSYKHQRCHSNKSIVMLHKDRSQLLLPPIAHPPCTQPFMP